VAGEDLSTTEWPQGRHFLGWDRPALPAAVDWLLPWARAMNWDLASLTLVVATNRAQRRLTELLVDAAGGALLASPAILTLGRLPDELLGEQPPIASDLEARLARMLALREADPADREPLVPRPPAEDDWPGWWTLASQLHDLAADLAAHRLTPAAVPKRCADRDIELPHPERWEALARLEQAYHRRLEQAGLIDQQAARLTALRDGQCQHPGPIVLLAAADLNPMVTGMLEVVQAAGTPVTALVHAPATHAEGFDALGGLDVDYWAKQPVTIDEASLRFVDRPADQPRAAVQAIRQAHARATRHEGAGYSTDEVTVGLGDESLARPMQRTLQRAGLPARYGPGQPLARTRPAMLLQALGEFAQGQTFDAFAELLRHPDIESYLHHQAKPTEASESDGGVAKAREHWLTLLDRYGRDHLQGRVDGTWLGSSADRQRLKALWQAITALLPLDDPTARRLPDWSKPLAEALTRVYGQTPLDRYGSEDEPLIRALQTLGTALSEQASLNPDAALTPTVTLSQAITLTRLRLADQTLPEPGGQSAVELMGYLDLAMDDAPLAVVTALNEGSVPAAVNADPLLPDNLRRQLSMADNARRYARDLLRLKALLASRHAVTLLAARQTNEGEPLSPSRLLLACDDATLQSRLKRFYDTPESSAPTPLLQPGPVDRFTLPMPEPVQTPATLSVTAFRDYLACPYRFYLKHICRLDESDDAHDEMDAGNFGSLAHTVLKQFGQSEACLSDDPETIQNFLEQTLDQLAARQFGKRISQAAVLIQLEQLKYRLKQFARRQAELVSEGWRIYATEQPVEMPITRHGETITLQGRIDRIDYHPQAGYRILDYKTSDTAKTPNQTHRGRDAEGDIVWQDLQLPLYHAMAQTMGWGEAPTVGFFNLPKQEREVDVSLAQWDASDLAEALSVRDWVLEQIQAGVFWPPGEPPHYHDALSRLCADEAMQRDVLIRASDASARGG
jgi:inactivated superfamily I helicase